MIVADACSSLIGYLTFARYLQHLKAIRTIRVVVLHCCSEPDCEGCPVKKCHLPFLGISTGLRSTVFTEAIFLIGGIYWKSESWRDITGSIRVLKSTDDRMCLL